MLPTTHLKTDQSEFPTTKGKIPVITIQVRSTTVDKWVDTHTVATEDAAQQWLAEQGEIAETGSGNYLDGRFHFAELADGREYRYLAASE